MSRSRAILLVVEGERAEPRLMGRALELCGISDVKAIYSYQANIYDLYRTMFEGAEDVDDLYLPLVLREGERDPEKRKLLNRDYTDIILIFDFDPQDHLFSQWKLEEMVSYFDESTENGKLYVNYPMVEAYRDLARNGCHSERTVHVFMVRHRLPSRSNGSLPSDLFCLSGSPVSFDYLRTISKTTRFLRRRGERARTAL